MCLLLHHLGAARSTEVIELDDAETRVVRRTTTTPVRNIKADRRGLGSAQHLA